MAKSIQRIFPFFISIFFTLSAFSQNRNGIIQGKVLTSDGQPAGGVSIQVLKTAWGAISDDKGNFRIGSIRPGSYTIKASAVSSLAQEKTFSVSAGQILRIDFELEVTASDLSEVVVSNRRLDRENAIPAKIPLKNLENPQVYNSVSSELMKQQNITSFDDALRNVPNLSRTWESTGRAGDGGAQAPP